MTQQGGNCVLHVEGHRDLRQQCDSSQQVWRLILLSVVVFAIFAVDRLSIRSMWARGDLAPLWPTARRLFFDLFTWDLGNNGGPAVWPAYIVMGMLWQVGHILGLSVGTMQALEEAGYHAGAAAAAAYLAARLFPGRRFLPLAAGIFYTFNFDWIINSPTAVLLLRVLVPLWLALYLDFCRAVEESRTQHARWFALGFAVSVSAGAPYAAINLPQLVVAVLGTLVFVTLCLVSPGQRRCRIRASALLFLFTAGASAWWLPVVGTYYLTAIVVPGAGIHAIVDVVQWSWTHSRNSFLNIFQLNPFWAWSPEYFSFWSIYFSPVLQIFTFIPTIFVLAAIILAKTYRDRQIVFGGSILLCVLVFLSKGLHEPWSGINLWLYRHVPGMWLLREPYTKLSVFTTLLVAILIGYSIDKWTKSTEKIFLLFLIFLCLVASFPLLSGRMLQAGTSMMPNGYVSIPEYWQDFAEYSSRYIGRRILVLPSDDFYLTPYVWGSYVPAQYFLPDRIVPIATVRRQFGYLSLTPAYDRRVEEIYRRLEDPELADADPAATFELLGQLGIEYLLVRNDLADRRVLPLGSPAPDPRLEVIRKRLVGWGMSPERSFGALELYHVPETWGRPRIFPASSGALPGIQSQSGPIDISEKKDHGAQLVEVTIQTPRGDRVQVEAHPPNWVTFQMLNPTAYCVRIEGAQGPVLLVLQESFHPLWKVHMVRQPYCATWGSTAPARIREYPHTGVREVGGEFVVLSRALLHGWLAPTLPEQNHFLADGYANAWLIEESGDYDLLIEFLPQRLFTIGLIITAATLLIFTSYVTVPLNAITTQIRRLFS